MCALFCSCVDQMQHLIVQPNFVQIHPTERVNVNFQRKKKARQSLQVKDDTDAIKICVWGDKTKQCKGLSVGDVIKVTNVKVNMYYGNASLNSTTRTEILTVGCWSRGYDVTLDPLGYDVTLDLISLSLRRFTVLEPRI